MTIQELRAKLGTELGFGGWFSSFDGTPAAYADLSAADQATLTNAMLAYIREHPADFTAAQVAQAHNLKDVQGPDTSSEALSVFVDEVANQAERINPFSGANMTKTAIVFALVLVGGVVAYSFARGGGSIVVNSGKGAAK